MSRVHLKGMTWSHPRGYNPVVACAEIWQKRHDVTILWDKRSLQDFESFPVDELAAAYDLIIIDHPHVGQITAEGCLLPLDEPDRKGDLAALARASVGRSFESYNWKGRQWGLPVDAATQVQAYRPDLLARPPERWDEVLDLARTGAVMIPLRPPHNLMTFYSLAANLLTPCSTTGPDLIGIDKGVRVLAMMRELASLVDPACADMDPIAVLEAMAESGSAIACVPLTYGYVSYAIDGFRDRLVRFANVPAAGPGGRSGTALGGTGIAVSARSRHPKEAIDFAYWLADAEAQTGPYVEADGQAGHAAAWEDPAINRHVNGFYADTRETLEGAWVRPRHDGYMTFQDEASACLKRALAEKGDAASVIAELNAMFARSLRRG